MVDLSSNFEEFGKAKSSVCAPAQNFVCRAKKKFFIISLIVVFVFVISKAYLHPHRSYGTGGGGDVCDLRTVPFFPVKFFLGPKNRPRPNTKPPSGDFGTISGGFVLASGDFIGLGRLCQRLPPNWPKTASQRPKNGFNRTTLGCRN